jgi:hypothetical protein
MFRDTATRETTSLAAAERAGAALRNGRLHEAEKLIHLIATDSVYRVALGAQLALAERPVVEETRRRAIAMAATHDCDALRRFQAQQTTASSSDVAAAAVAVTCSEKPATVAPARVEAVSAARPATAAKGSAATPFPPPCDTTNVNDIMTRAVRAYSEGHAQQALEFIEAAFECTTDERMYRLAGMYACVAHDLPKAKLYFTKVSQAARPNLEQRCQLEGLNLRDP